MPRLMILASLLFAGLATTACGRVYPPTVVLPTPTPRGLPDFTIDGWEIAQLHPRACPVPDEPVDDYWRKALLDVVQPVWEKEGATADLESVRAMDSLRWWNYQVPAGTVAIHASALNAPGYNFPHCIRRWLWIQVTPWDDQCAQLYGYFVVPCE